MIKPRRKQHRVMMTGLAVIVPALFIAGILMRPPAPSPGQLSAGMQAAPATSAMTLVEAGDVDSFPILAYRILDLERRRYLELKASPAWRVPELLVYWIPAHAGDSFEEGVLLGSWAVTTTKLFTMPPQSVETNGTLRLYDLTKGEVVGSARLQTP